MPKVILWNHSYLKYALISIVNSRSEIWSYKLNDLGDLARYMEILLPAKCLNISYTSKPGIRLVMEPAKKEVKS